MWNGNTVSVVLMTYAERDSIRSVIDGFLQTGFVDEVLVVDNNAQPGTREEVAKTPARMVHEPRQGYGFAIRRGLLEASGDLVVLAEPDGTFLPEDLTKLLVYSNECDVVFGTRTTRELIWADANMDWFLRWGNWAVAKLIEVIFNTSHLSDVGCTYRLLRRQHEGRRQPRRRGDHAADGCLGGALRRGTGQLPSARRRLVRDRQADGGDPGWAPDDQPDRALQVHDAAAADEGPGLCACSLGSR
jgi:glycosyltransferase involved in cell wall biosynthesis